MSKCVKKYLSCLLALLTVTSALQPAAVLASDTGSNTGTQALWLTEIYSNDLARNALFNGLSGPTIDSMDYIEVYNASDSELNFGSDFDLVYTETASKALTYNEPEVIIPAHSPAVFWIRRVDLENGEAAMPSEADFRSSNHIPAEVPVFSVNNQKALKNTTATISITAKGNNEPISTYTYDTTDVGSMEGTSVHLQAAQGTSGMLALDKQAAPSAGQVREAQTTLFSKIVLTAGTVTRSSETAGAATFTSSTAGSYYYAIVSDGAAAPAIDTTGSGTPVSGNAETSIALTGLAAGAQDLYVVVKGSANQVSDALKFDIPDFNPNTSLFLTEIYPNDIPRHQDYTGLSGDTIDSMDYIEVYNASDNELDFGANFNLIYTDTSALPLVNKTFTFNETVLKIPAHSPAIFWVRRVDLENKGKTMPDEADFREALRVPNEVPVFSVKNQTALKNTTAQILITAKGSNETLSTYSYVTADAGTTEGTSVHLQAAEGMAGALAIAKQAEPTAGQVSDIQLTPKADPGVVPKISLSGSSGQYNFIEEGQDLSIPYSYSDPTGIKSFTVFYRTDQSAEWTAQESNSFNTRTPGKFYVEIGADRYLNREYIEYYAQAANTFRTAATPIHRVNVTRQGEFTGIRSNLKENEAVAGKVSIMGRARNNAGVDIKVDGNVMKNTRTLEQGAYFTLDINGLDGRKNAILANGKLVQVFSRWYDVLPSRAVLIDSSLFKYNQAGDAEITVNILAGTEIDAMDTTPGTASDNFNITNFTMTWPDGTVVLPDGAVKSTDAITMNSSRRQLELHFTIPAGLMNASRTDWDTTLVPDGPHTVSFSSGGDSKEISVRVDNTGPVIQSNVPSHIDGEFNMKLTYQDASDVASDTLVLELDGKKLNGTTFNGSELSPGTHTLNAAVQDKLGNTGTKEWKFTSSKNHPVISGVNSITAQGNTATLTAALSAGQGSTVSFHEAQALTVGKGITVYQGTGDHTADALSGQLGQVASDNGSLPYQMYAFDVAQANSSLRISIDAATDYGKDVRLYVSNQAADQWILLDSSYEAGKVTAVLETDGYLRDGKVYVLAQGRGIEMPPSQQAGRKPTSDEDQPWDGTGDPAEYDFTIAWESDTQYYSERFPSNFEILNKYSAANKDRLDTRYVVHTGDIVDDIDEIYQWEYADKYMNILSDAGLPYGVLAGNHDIANHNGRYHNYQKYFGEDRFKNNSVYGGSYNNNIGHYDLVTAGGQDLIFVYMSYDFDQASTAWINKVLAEHPDRIAVLALHNYVNASGELDTAGKYFQNEVVAKNPNLKLILGGHYHGAAIQVSGFDDDGDGTKERKVYQILTDYQTGEEGGNSYYKTLYFNLAKGKVYMNSYSPKLKDFNYFDTPKLNSYGIGVQAADQDIYELDFAFDTRPKTLTVKSVDAVLYSNTAIATAAVTNASASITVKDLAAITRDSWLAIATNSAGQTFSKLAAFGKDSSHPSVPPGGNSASGANNDNTDKAYSIKSSTAGNVNTLHLELTASTGSSGEAAATLSSAAAAELLDAVKAAEKAGRTVALDIALKAKGAAVVGIPQALIQALANHTKAQMRIDAGVGKVALDQGAIQAVNASSANVNQVEIRIAKSESDSRPVYNISVHAGGRAITDLDKGRVWVSTPYSLLAGEDQNAIIAARVKDKGELEPVRGKYNPITKAVEFTTGELAAYMIRYQKVTFNDVTSSAWYYDAITFNAARGIALGTGQGEFSPNESLTRGQFLVMLMRAYGIQEDHTLSDNFSDAGHTYYTSYLASAKKLGITTGIGDNKFAPDSEITRQDMFTLVYRVLESLQQLPERTSSQSIKDYNDGAKISPYASEALNALIQAGMIKGDKGNLHPANGTTRAELAQMLYNLLSL
ncbi:S-layer homology domain-containing protein [Paenibacillus sp. YPG26]|uniref:S-layer homology domain-containing protein n=1 Tax=Paenibacillus sp. YPG26 TaxID=2878915 RepID=UPI00203DDB73|nr:S-layer homology domain-containing protein [Paenibacillus sp. YPG26]USB32693.1 S-layer homology domain-containing protein [Paenibacillus sp. YPG26]